MLVLSRKVDEVIWIGPQIKITVVRVQGGHVRLGFDAPKGMKIVREELMNEDARTGDIGEDRDDTSEN